MEGKAQSEHRDHRGWRRLAAPHWPAALAALAVGGAYLLVPQRLRLGPSWLLLGIEGALLIPLLLAHFLEKHSVSHWLGRAMTALATLAVTLSAVFLVTRLPGGKTPGSELLGSSALIYLSNVLVFALWYWEIDAGGPMVRRRGQYASRDFVFPQFQQDPQAAALAWAPSFIDYLFLAFNTSTAFSPTDTLVLSPRAKLLMMAQSVISLIAVAVLAARAINVL
jgi:hypothetical protein